MFSYEFCDIFKNTVFRRTSSVAASVKQTIKNVNRDQIVKYLTKKRLLMLKVTLGV